MAKNKREWNEKFLEYMDFIINHENYNGLPIDKKEDGSYQWVATAESETGKKRIVWCENKAKELGLVIQAGVYADVMLTIHPTKLKVCQTCGKIMSLYYHYPNLNFLKSLNKEFSSNFTMCDHIADIWDTLIKEGISEIAISKFLIKKGNLELDPHTASKEDIINALEYTCRKGNKKCLGPGAMSNFPDRFDGFHSYNRCCRGTQDKGRSKDNLKSYTKDRRAYEYWSDGNIQAANQFMGSKFFKGISADHIGPISLGFIHDPRYLQPMICGDNSSKRDRLQYEDILKIIETEKRTKIYPMSWYSAEIWEYIKQNYESNKDKISGIYRDALKQNMANFMYILGYILTKCNLGEQFLTKAFLEKNCENFKYSYTFNESGEIISKTNRHFTKRNRDEHSRYKRIAIKSVYDYQEKNNRKSSISLINSDIEMLDKICLKIDNNSNIENIKKDIILLMKQLQERLILHL